MNPKFDRAKHEKIMEEVIREVGLNVWVVTEERDGVPVRYHHVPTPEAYQPGRYISIVSLNAFQNRELKRWAPVWRAGKKLPFGYGFHERLHSILVKERYFNYKNETGLPVVKHASVWEFYKAIGYDHKKNKYLAIPVNGSKLAP